MIKNFSLKYIFSKAINNNISIARLSLLYLFLPWLLLDIISVTLFISSIKMNSGILMGTLIYLIGPVFLIYLSIISFVITKKSFSLDSLIKKYMGIIFFGLVGTIFAILGFMLIAVGLNVLFTG